MLFWIFLWKKKKLLKLCLNFEKWLSTIIIIKYSSSKSNKTTLQNSLLIIVNLSYFSCKQFLKYLEKKQFFLIIYQFTESYIHFTG